MNKKFNGEGFGASKKNEFLIKKPAITEEPLTLVESNACY